MAAMGFGVSWRQACQIIDAIVNQDEPEVSQLERSEKVMRCIFKIYPDLITTMAAPLDPQCASKATEEVQDAMFTKLDAYVQIVNTENLVPWESYKDIPKDCIYNMDEVGTDTTEHRNNFISQF